MPDVPVSLMPETRQRTRKAPDHCLYKTTGGTRFNQPGIECDGNCGASQHGRPVSAKGLEE
jgi:hypothetical protein